SAPRSEPSHAADDPHHHVAGGGDAAGIRIVGVARVLLFEPLLGVDERRVVQGDLRIGMVVPHGCARRRAVGAVRVGRGFAAARGPRGNRPEGIVVGIAVPAGGASDARAHPPDSGVEQARERDRPGRAADGAVADVLTDVAQTGQAEGGSGRPERGAERPEGEQAWEQREHQPGLVGAGGGCAWHLGPDCTWTARVAQARRPPGVFDALGAFCLDGPMNPRSLVLAARRADFGTWFSQHGIKVLAYLLVAILGTIVARLLVRRFARKLEGKPSLTQEL